MTESKESPESLEEKAEQLVSSMKKEKPYSILVYRIMGIGIVKTGAQIGDTKYWHFKKGDCIRNQIMKGAGVLIQYADGTSEYRYNSFYDKLYPTPKKNESKKVQG